jgi:hypothetical protein
METILPPKVNSQDSEVNKENGYPVPDSNKTKTMQRNPMKPTRTENFMEMLLDMANQNIQEALKKFQDNENKEYEQTQKQISELIGALNKHQSETENTINTDK